MQAHPLTQIPALLMKLGLLVCWPILLVTARAETVTFPVGTLVTSSGGTYTVIRGDYKFSRTGALSINTFVDACKKIEDFMEVLNNWYIRRNRERFWSDGLSQNKISAYNTLYTCLLNIAKISAPIIPYLAEEIYLGLA
jgi:hypothetical protein